MLRPLPAGAIFRERASVAASHHARVDNLQSTEPAVDIETDVQAPFPARTGPALLTPERARRHPQLVSAPTMRFGPTTVGTLEPYRVEGGVAVHDVSGAAARGDLTVLVDDGGTSGDYNRLRVLRGGEARELSLQAPHKDIEDITALPDGSFVLTTSLSGDDDASRRTTRVVLHDDGTRILAETSVDLREPLLEALTQRFGARFVERVRAAPAKEGGLNIEGIAAVPTATDSTFLFGLRSPLVASASMTPAGEEPPLHKGRAVIARVEAPFGGAPRVRLEELDLEGHGVRGMEFIPALRGTVIIGGPVEKGDGYSLWLWRGGDDVERLHVDGFDGLRRPESVLQVTEGGRDFLVIMSEQSGPACEGAPYNVIKVPLPSRAAPVADRRALAGRAFAAIDLGSSSGKLLVERVGPDGTLRQLVDAKIGAALGKGVENGAPIPAENQRRALDALTRFIAEAARAGVDAADIPVITTAVVRNTSNGGAFLDAVRALGLVQARVLSGEQEAEMGFRGALFMTNGAPGRYATLDLGGGSFQLAVGTEAGLEQGASTQVGSNVIVDTLLAPAAAPDGACDPSVFEKVDAALKSIAPMPVDPALLHGRTLVATGGISKFLRQHFGADVVERDAVDALRREVIARPAKARVALVRGSKDDETQKALGIDTEEGALDYGKKLPASASLLLHILDALGVTSVRVSETDARHVLVDNAINDALSR